MSGEIFRFFAVDDSASADLSADNGMNMNNRPARYDASGFLFLDDSGKPDEVYYPLESDMRYVFYGYCVGGSSAQVFPADVSADRITVEVPVTTHGDILCGNTSVGVNGKIVRESMQENPFFALDLSFRHVTSGVSFSTVLDAQAAFPGGSGVAVVSLELEDMPSVAELCILDRSDAGRSSTGYFLPYDSEGKSVVFDELNHIVTSSESCMCDEIFIVPVEGGLKAVLTVSLGGEEHVLDITQGIEAVNSEFGVDTYDAGSLYRYRLVFGYSAQYGLTVKVEAGK